MGEGLGVSAGWESDMKPDNQEEQTNYVEDVFKNMGFNMNLLNQNGLEEEGAQTSARAESNRE